MSTRSPLRLPVSRRRYQFVLTPLADAMFQLLIFFMLSTNLTPYSLLTLRSALNAGAVAGAGVQPLPAPAPNSFIWTIRNGEIVANGQRFPLTQLQSLVKSMDETGVDRIVLVATSDAQVQDLTTVLEVLAASNIQSIQIARAMNRP
jgi:biopolymer transport protein ExbD